ncbi:unnamed protein product [Cyclocybe aegerita]|uniref:phosphatidylinositol-3,4,5-trisphosphate 3-phosphatase n=1 Tax=Cyclocybe aegerita TaxID=1973307 RepID=A0A8S0VTB8_CYCAE|nr:unnamed protein product [Cyclocybe aegerita]
MPLVAREMDAWLKGSPDRVAVLHCKAGKGRSGTMACTYLLSLDDIPMSPQLQRSYTVKEWAKRRLESAIETLPPDEDTQLTFSKTSSTTNPLSPLCETPGPSSDVEGILDIEKGSPPPTATANPERSFTDALKGVLDLHTARRMKQEEGNSKAKQGVSIPSQRRFLYYWALLLAHDAPKHVWAVDYSQSVHDAEDRPPFQRSTASRPKVRLTQLKLRMRETSGMKLSIIKAANKVIERTNLAKGPDKPLTSGTSKEKEKEKSSSSSSQVWASLARYDDTLVDLLEEWETHTRDSDGHMGKRRPGSEHMKRGETTEEDVLNEVFLSGKWDKGKMVRSFARLGVTDGAGEVNAVDEKEGNIYIYTLRPLSDKRWEGLKHDLQKNASNAEQTLDAINTNAEATGLSRSETNSMYDITTAGLKAELDQGIILDAGREIRVKLYMGQVFMGWLWFIPTFHMPQPPPTASTTLAPESLKSTLRLTRKELDFPLGLGSSIIDVEMEMEWVAPARGQVGVEAVEPPLRARTEDSKIGTDAEPVQTGIAALAQVMVSDQEVEGEGTSSASMAGNESGGLGKVGIRETVEAKQGAKE